MEEIWKDIPNYEGLYQASNLGRIKSLSRIAKKEYRNNRIVKEKILNGTKNEDGYLKVHLKNNERNINKVLFIHRLVAQTFIENPNNLPQVNHKSGIKTDNRVCNLEWCTNLYNQQHAWKNKLHKSKSIKVKKYDKNNKFIKEYDSMTKAIIENKISFKSLKGVLENKKEYAGGYKWIYSMK